MGISFTLHGLTEIIFSSVLSVFGVCIWTSIGFRVISWSHGLIYQPPSFSFRIPLSTTTTTMSVPLRVPRLVTYALTWCFAVISSAFGLNALIKSRQDEHKLKSLVSPPTVLDINVNGKHM